MMTLELDDETAGVLNQLANEQHLSPAQLVKTALLEYLEDCQDTKRTEAAYQANKTIVQFQLLTQTEP